MKMRVGTTLGRYEILAEIGRGAMGIVYRARDPKIDRVVAVKTISLLGQEPEDEREYRERFVIEARAAGRLSHTGIVTVFDVGEELESHDPYIVMEYVAGEPLKKLLSDNGKKIALASALQLVQELAEALYYAHGQGVIHRDIKPSNILVTPGCHAKITDFGVAKLNLSNITASGSLVGSPAYMSPEQLNGEGVDARSDLFSLGVVLYTMVTGYRPFQGNSAETVCFKVVNRDPLPATAFDAELPPQLDEIIARAMAKDPGERYQSGAEMAHAIEGFRQEHASLQRSVTSESSTTGTSLNKIRALTENLQTVSTSTHAQPQQPLAKRRLNLPDKAYVGAATLLLAIASFILYRGIIATISLRSESVTAPVSQAPTMPHATTTAPATHPTSEKLKNVRKAAPTKTLSVSPPLTTTTTHVAMSDTTATATLKIDIHHPFANGITSVWLDNQLAYTRSLHGAAKTRAFVFRQVQGHESDSIELPSGDHVIHVRVESADDSYDQSKTISGTFVKGGESILHVHCDRRGSGLDLVLQSLTPNMSAP